MRFRRVAGLFAIVAATAGLLVGAGVPASAATPPPSIGTVKAYVTVSPAKPAHGQPEQAFVQATYTCYGGTAANHVWVSVKQGPGDLSTEGSSAKATAWYDAHPDNHVCNGQPVTTVFTIFQHLDKGPLLAGTGYLQFCIVPGGGNDFAHIAIKNLNVTILRPGGPPVHGA